MDQFAGRMQQQQGGGNHQGQKDWQVSENFDSFLVSVMAAPRDHTKKDGESHEKQAQKGEDLVVTFFRPCVPSCALAGVYAHHMIQNAVAWNTFGQNSDSVPKGGHGTGEERTVTKNASCAFLGWLHTTLPLPPSPRDTHALHPRTFFAPMRSVRPCVGRKTVK